jgi:hypothetical protein
VTAPASKPPMVAVIIGNLCRGFILNRRGNFEAFNIDEQSIGTFTTESEAVAAIMECGQ